MAIYTHFEIANSPSASWGGVMGSSYTASPSIMTIVNSDGTLTKAFGSFIVANGNVLGGLITSLERTSGNGATVYESITGTAINANVFVVTPSDDKLSLAFVDADTLNGNSVAEFLNGGAQSDALYGNGGDDYLNGGAQNDALYGNGGDDGLDGGTGADLMAGGPGLDHYTVDDPGDVVVEAPDEGDDLVTTSLANYTLPANVNRLAFTTSVSHAGTGNELDNIITANSGKDTLFGLGGNDTFHGLGGGDTFHGGQGNDVFSVGAGDVVIELPGEGTDAVHTSLTNYTLPANVENLTLSGGPGLAFGNELDNKIVVNGGAGHTVYGLGGNDTLSSTGGSDNLDGGSGDDKLTGSSETDTLTGGTGDDTFIIYTGNQTITDFVAGAGTADRIDLASYKPGTPQFGQNLFTSLADIFAHATQVGADTIIDLGAGNSLALKDVQKGSLVATDFIGIVNLTGGPGADLLVGSSADELFDGAGGDDTALFSQNLGQYTLQDFGSKIMVVGPEGTDILTGIEHLQFADATLNVVDDGNPLFDTLYYLSRNVDVFQAGVNALDHFNTFGWHEGRDPNGFFDTSGYLAVNKDVASAGVNPLEHYHQSGWHEGRDPSADFDTTLYLVHNPDVAAAGVDPLAHYLQYGMVEGRAAYEAVGSITGGFDAQYYLFHNPDVAAAGVDPLEHFNTSGWHEGRNPNAFFDTAGYLAHYADVAAAGVNPLQHYLTSGWHEGRDPSATFDTLGYLGANPDVAAAGVNPLEHYLQYGIYEGRTAMNDGLWA